MRDIFYRTNVDVPLIRTAARTTVSEFFLAKNERVERHVPPQVGSIVRAQLPEHTKATCKALVETIQDERSVWQHEPTLLVAPIFKDAAVEEVESTILIEDIQDLLLFKIEAESEFY